eukprot:superscaffoldBa00001876_g12352
MVVAPKALLWKVGDLLFCSICSSPQVCNLGVILDSSLLFQLHIKSITISTFYHFKNISKHWPSLSDSSSMPSSPPVWITAKKSCPGPRKSLDRLQYVQKSAARVLTHTKPWQHITPTLIHLHGLSVKSSIS